MSRRGNPFRAAVAALRADNVAMQKKIAANDGLIADLLSREGGTGGGTLPARHIPSPKIERRRRRRRARVRRVAKTVPVQARRKQVRAGTAVAATPAAPKPVAAVSEPAKAVRGAAQFGPELKAIGEIVLALAKADKALGKAARAKDNVTITMLTEEIHGLRRRGNDLLVRLDGKARLPIDKSERMRWRRAAAQAEPPKKRRAPRKVTPAPTPPVKRDSGWHDDGAGNLVREIASQ
jgi:hypothetical protein